MSYSFEVKAPTKNEASAAVAEKLLTVVQGQPSHDADAGQVQAAVDALLALMPDNAAKDVRVSCSGWLSGDWKDGAFEAITAASLNVTLGLVERINPN